MEEYNSYYEQLKYHELEKLDVGGWDVYRMYDPKWGKGTMAVTIIFSPNGIILNGDFAPGNRGMNSVAGYGVAWFGTKKNAYYLAEKFIGEMTYDGDLAYKEWKQFKLDDDNEMTDEIESIINDPDYHRLDWEFEYPVYQLFSKYLVDFWDYSFGHGYNENKLDHLVAIQQRFMELYQEN